MVICRKNATFVSMKIPSIFNCSNDMALAAHVRQYLPPKRIQQMEADLADLARVWKGTRFAGPWGWSLATKQRYKQMGVPVDALPSDEWLEEVRRLSSREFACGYVEKMRKELKDERLLGGEMKWVGKDAFGEDPWSVKKTYPSGTLCRTPRVRGAVPEGYGAEESSNPMDADARLWVFKSPWSSSGRGVFVGDGCEERTRARLQGFLSSQGGFVVDRFYEDKVLDFAMEFFIHEDHAVEFLGYSVFVTGEHGAYGYNEVKSQADLLKRIDADEALLQQLIEYHREHLAKIAYHGPVGIDMLKTADGSIHPCLEINLRMNMGILALLLFERYGEHATVALMPQRLHGFQACVDDGKLQIVYRR